MGGESPIYRQACEARLPLLTAGRTEDSPVEDDVEGGYSQRKAPSWADVNALPPLPTPDHCTMCAEAACGCTFVLVLIAFFVGTAHSISYYAGGSIRTATLFCIYAEAVIAIICLLGLLIGDPGVIKRSPEVTFPLPARVTEFLAQGKPLDELQNITEERGTFCVRCLVWRPAGSAGSEVHHCNTCQRCVKDFDHHCGVFGRCIAGNGFGGNMGYFKTLIGMACVAAITCIAFGVAASGSGMPHAMPHPLPRSSASRAASLRRASERYHNDLLRRKIPGASQPQGIRAARDISATAQPLAALAVAKAS
mmetsp:Transcript_38945/g.64683  ORF Transcript_38945/g.64683 Transcript_38945/m.64683 type:complete len:308 (+) Transcript_38945:52-975(+)